MATDPNLLVFPNVDDVAKNLRTYVLDCQSAAFARHDTFKIAVSGGSLPATLAKALLTPGDGSEKDIPQLGRWEIFFADERAVPLDHEDSNYRLVKQEWIDKIPEGTEKPKVFPVDVDHLKDTQELADQYQKVLMDSFVNKDSVKLPIFDLLLLGCGPDGHTCSLFPGHALLKDEVAWVAPIEDSPKPPPRRITLTLPVVTHALSIAFVATGGGKKGIMKSIFDTDEGQALPCGLVNKAGGNKVSWFSDVSAVEGVKFPQKGSL